MNLEDRETIDKITELLTPILLEGGYELVDMLYGRLGRGCFLKVFLDKEGGINVNDCAKVSRELGYILDVHDVVPDKYTLEVSSPGLTRPLKNSKDFEKFRGKKIRVKTKQPIMKKNFFIGKLIDVSEGTVILEEEGAEYSIPLEVIQKANLELEF